MQLYSPEKSYSNFVWVRVAFSLAQNLFKRLLIERKWSGIVMLSLRSIFASSYFLSCRRCFAGSA